MFGIIDIDIHLGLVHGSVEKLIEVKIWNQALCYFGRLDYVSSVIQEEVFMLFRINDIDSICLFNRLSINELIKVTNHLLAVSCPLGDVSAIKSILLNRMI